MTSKLVVLTIAIMAAIGGLADACGASAQARDPVAVLIETVSDVSKFQGQLAGAASDAQIVFALAGYEAIVKLRVDQLSKQGNNKPRLLN